MNVHAVVIDRNGDPPRNTKRMLEFVRPGDTRWTFVLKDEHGHEVVYRHDDIQRWINTGEKR